LTGNERAREIHPGGDIPSAGRGRPPRDDGLCFTENVADFAAFERDVALVLVLKKTCTGGGPPPCSEASRSWAHDYPILLWSHWHRFRQDEAPSRAAADSSALRAARTAQDTKFIGPASRTLSRRVSGLEPPGTCGSLSQVRVAKTTKRVPRHVVELIQAYASCLRLLVDVALEQHGA